MNVYELEGNLAVLATMLESGEIDEDVYKDTVESMPIDENVEYFAKMRKNFAATEENLNTEIKRLTERKKSLQAAQERCNETIKHLLMMAEKQTIRTPLFTVTVRRNAPKVVITNEDTIPFDYKQPKFVVSKDAIKEALLSGAEIPGAELQTGESVTVR